MFLASFIGFFCLERKSSGILNWATTCDWCVIRKITLRFCFVRYSMESFPHFVFRFFLAETSASKNLSASMSYFTVRRARYSLG